MSEMVTTPQEPPWRTAASRHRLPFRNLRLLIAPAYPNELIVSLVVVPLNGHPTLHPHLRQLRTPWYPEHHQGEVEAYALRVAFLRASQTRL